MRSHPLTQTPHLQGPRLMRAGNCGPAGAGELGEAYIISEPLDCCSRASGAQSAPVPRPLPRSSN